jgi:hypothetical protein
MEGYAYVIGWPNYEVYIGYRNWSGIPTTTIIQPGTIIKIGAFGELRSAIRNKGTLDARGTPSKPIVFTSIKDDTPYPDLLYPDTNNDGASTTPAAGDWRHIYFDPSSQDWTGTSGSVLEYVIVRYGGDDSIIIDRSAPRIASSTIEYFRYTGINISLSGSETPQIIRNTIRGVRGINVSGNAGSDALIAGNQIYNTGDIGILLTNTNISIGTSTALLDESLINRIFNNGRYGIYITGYSSSTIQYTLIYYGSSAVGIYVGSNARLYGDHLTIHGNRIGIKTATSSIVVKNTLITNSIASGLEADPGNVLSWSFNDVWGNSPNYSIISDQTNQNGNLSVDPLYINAAAGDFHLSACSRVATAGENGTFMGAYGPAGVGSCYFDCGLRAYDGSSIVVIACEPEGTLTSSLRIRKGNTTYGIILVDPTDPNASKILINTPAGIKALRRF